MAPPDASLETADPSPPSHRRRWAIGIAVWAVVLGVVAFRFLTEDEAAPSASTAEALVLDLRVVDAAGAPVTGASVALRLDGEGPPLEAEIETNGAGQARIGGLRTGPASVDVVAEGFLPATETFELTENHALLVTLEKSRPLTGRVVDTSGGPIRAVSVRVESEDREQRFCEVETDAAGEFRCEVPEAPVSVEGRAPGYEVLAVVAGVTEDTVSLMLRRAGGIHGRVQGGPAGAVGASVTLGGSGVWPPRSVDVNPEGRFSFLGVPTGVYELRAYHPDGRVSAPAEGLVLEEGDTLEIDLRLGPGAILAGLVQTAEDGTPIADAEVLVAEESLFVSPRAARTDAEGRFEVRGLRPFLHRITVRAPGFVTTQERREPTAEEVFELRRGAVVYGTVTDPEGYPVGGALLGVTGVDEGGLPMLLDGPERAFQEALFEAQLRGPTGVQPSGELGVTLGEVPPIPSAPVAARGPTETSAPRDRYVTDADGRFRLSDLPPGQLQLTADHIDFAPTLSAPILTQPGGEHEVTLVLTPAGTLRGRVLDARDFPAPFVRVELQSEAERQPRAGLTDPDGFFEFTGVPENVTVTAFPVNFPPIRKTLTVLPGEVTETELRLEEAVERLALRVFDDREFPLGGARVNITSLRAASPFSRIGFSEDDGTLVFETLPEPPWKLQLVAAG
ncbi:MAG: carboxypeptidase-like regulatory domain-containing protein, partial [Myxococcota bacterium]